MKNFGNKEFVIKLKTIELAIANHEERDIICLEKSVFGARLSPHAAKYSFTASYADTPSPLLS